MRSCFHYYSSYGTFIDWLLFIVRYGHRLIIIHSTVCSSTDYYPSHGMFIDWLLFVRSSTDYYSTTIVIIIFISYRWDCYRYHIHHPHCRITLVVNGILYHYHHFSHYYCKYHIVVIIILILVASHWTWSISVSLSSLLSLSHHVDWDRYCYHHPWRITWVVNGTVLASSSSSFYFVSFCFISSVSVLQTWNFNFIIHIVTSYDRDYDCWSLLSSFFLVTSYDCDYDYYYFLSASKTHHVIMIINLFFLLQNHIIWSWFA